MSFSAKYATLAICALALSACGDPQSTPEVQVKANPIKPSQSTQVAVKAERTPMERGAILFKRCKACHTLDEGGRNKVGPNLWAIWDSQAASREGFAYSKALSEAGITWDEASLEAYIKKPKEFVPGTRMSFVGIKKDQDRADLLLYLKAQTTP